MLDTRYIEELLALVDHGDVDESVQLNAERERLKREIDNLIELAAAGTRSVAPKLQEREAALDRVEARLRIQRPAPPNIERLRATLEQRTAQWKADLRTEPQVSRLVLRRLIGPIVLWEEPEGWRWEAPKKTELLDGLVDVYRGWDAVRLMASPGGIAIAA